MDSIIGYKCFNADMTNRYEKQFEVGKVYIASGKIDLYEDEVVIFENNLKNSYNVINNINFYQKKRVIRR